MAGFLGRFLVLMVLPLGLLVLSGCRMVVACPDGFDAVGAASQMPGDPNVWTDGSLVLDQVTGVSSSGAGFFAHQSKDCWGGRRWGHVDHVRPEGRGSVLQGLLFCSWASSVSSEG